MCREVISQVVRVSIRVGSTYRADDLLKHRRLRVLLGHMIPELRLGEADLPADGAREGLRSV